MPTICSACNSRPPQAGWVAASGCGAGEATAVRGSSRSLSVILAPRDPRETGWDGVMTPSGAVVDRVR
jgi:hypothetical protein